MSKSMTTSDAPRRLAIRMLDHYGEMRKLHRRVERLARRDPSLEKWLALMVQAVIDAEHQALLVVIATDPTAEAEDIEQGNRQLRRPFGVRHCGTLFVATPATDDLSIPDNPDESFDENEPTEMQLLRLPLSRVAEIAIQAAEIAFITPKPGGPEPSEGGAP